MASDLRDFKASALAGATRLTARHCGSGWSLEELAAELGREVDDRLRNWVRRRIEDGVVRREGRGAYTIADGAAPAPGVEMVGAVRRAMYAMGGVATFGDVSLLIERSGEGNPDPEGRLTRRVLDESPLYGATLPFEGHRRDWWVVDPHRAGIPLPGRLHRLEAMFGGAANVGGWVAALRLRIGRALRDAREARGLETEEVATAAPVQVSLRRRMALAPGAAGDWWRSIVQEHGLETALAALWDRMEGEEGSGQIARLDVQTWMAVGKVLSVDPCLLSRGALGRPGTLSPFWIGEGSDRFVAESDALP